MPRRVYGNTEELVINELGMCRLAALAYGIQLIDEHNPYVRLNADALQKFVSSKGEEIIHASFPTREQIDKANETIVLIYKVKSEQEDRAEMERRRMINISLAPALHTCPICGKKKKKKGPCMLCGPKFLKPEIIEYATA